MSLSIPEIIQLVQVILQLKQDSIAGPVTLSAAIVKLGATIPPRPENSTNGSYRKTLVHALQAALGFDEAHCDGIDGRMTWTALLSKLGGAVTPTAPTRAPNPPAVDLSDTKLDPHTAKWLPTLHPKVQPLALAHWRAARAAGMPFRITSGLRSYAESDRLYHEHIYNHGPQAVPGGHSFHNFDEKFGGCAYDFTLWNETSNKPLWDSVPGGPNYKTVATLGEVGGMYCGFRFGDEPHMEYHAPWTKGMTEGQITSELRRRHDKGLDPV